MQIVIFTQQSTTTRTREWWCGRCSSAWCWWWWPPARYTTSSASSRSGGSYNRGQFRQFSPHTRVLRTVSLRSSFRVSVSVLNYKFPSFEYSSTLIKFFLLKVFYLLSPLSVVLLFVVFFFFLQRKLCL